MRFVHRGRLSEGHMMTKRILGGSLACILGVCALLLESCAPVSLRGRYTSEDDKGVLVFRPDGVFGYKFAAIFDFYSEENLPPLQGRYRVGGGRIELSDLPAGEHKFKLEIRDGGRSLLLIRQERNGSLPDRAWYRKETSSMRRSSQ